jgi:hypothetical protein
MCNHHNKACRGTKCLLNKYVGQLVIYVVGVAQWSAGLIISFFVFLQKIVALDIQNQKINAVGVRIAPMVTVTFQFCEVLL